MQTLTIEGMTCNHCVQSVTEALQEVEGVTSVKISLAKGMAEIDGVANTKNLIAAVQEAGYHAEIEKP
jgi:copper chaperone